MILPMWLSMGLTTTGRSGPMSGTSWAETCGVNPAARTSPRITVQGTALTRLALINRIGFKLFIVSTLQLKSALAKRVRQRIHPHQKSKSIPNSNSLVFTLVGLPAEFRGPVRSWWNKLNSPK